RADGRGLTHGGLVHHPHRAHLRWLHTTISQSQHSSPRYQPITTQLTAVPANHNTAHRGTSQSQHNSPLIPHHIIYITFSHLADAFVQSDVQGREQSS